MSYCPKCGKEVPSDAMFCPYCGSSLGSVDEAFHKSAQDVEKAVEEYTKTLISASLMYGGLFGFAISLMWMLIILGNVGNLALSYSGTDPFIYLEITTISLVVILWVGLGISDFRIYRPRLKKQIKDLLSYFARK